MQRYKAEVNHGEPWMEPDPAGDYVLWEDVQASLAKWQPLDSAPKDGNEVTVGAFIGGGLWTARAVWFFGAWASAGPCLGEPLEFAPTHWLQPTAPGE